MAVTWNTWTYYDPVLDGEAICITGYTGRGAYWVKVPLTQAGKSRRAQREEMLARIEATIEAGAEPGEVSIEGPPPAPKQEGEHVGPREDRGLWG